MQYVNPLQTLHRDIPSDSWFPQDGHTLLETAFEGSAKGIKRGRGKKNQLTVLKSVDEEDDIEFRVSTPMSASQQNDKSVTQEPKKKKPRTTRCASKRKMDETPVQPSSAMSSSNLTSLLTSTTIKEKRTRRKPPKKSSEQAIPADEQRPFKLPVITRPMSQDRNICKTTDSTVGVVNIGPPIEIEKISAPASIQHLARLTTEETLKQKENFTTISKTTIRKLKSLLHLGQPSPSGALEKHHDDQRPSALQDKDYMLKPGTLGNRTNFVTGHEHVHRHDSENTQRSGVVAAEPYEEVLVDFTGAELSPHKDGTERCIISEESVGDAHCSRAGSDGIVVETVRKVIKAIEFEDHIDEALPNPTRNESSQSELLNPNVPPLINESQHRVDHSSVSLDDGHMEVEAFDEYDDGLDDADLLEIEGSQLHGNIMRQNQALVPMQADGLNSLNVQHRHPPAVVELVSDDEFDIDADDEEAMLQLPELISDISMCSDSDLSKEESHSEVYKRSITHSSPLKHKGARTLQAQPSKVAPKDLVHQLSSEGAVRTASQASTLSQESMSSSAKSNASKHIKESQANDDTNFLALRDTLKHVDAIATKRRPLPDIPQAELSADLQALILLDPNYFPLRAFARPNFPSTIRERSPVIGLSCNTFLRTCFKIGEMLNEGKRCNSFGQSATLELFARVVKSHREEGTTKQHFTFFDLWSEYPPHPHGILDNYRSSALVESESRAFVDAASRGEYLMARCIGRLLREPKNTSRWFLQIHNIRETDWEEIRWTKQIASACGVKTEKT